MSAAGCSTHGMCPASRITSKRAPGMSSASERTSAGGVEPSSQQVEVLLSSALEACECYFQAFQFVVWSGTSARDALASVLFETHGTA